MSKEMRRLPCALTTEETLQRGKSLASTVETYDRVEAEMKEHAETFRAKLKEHRRQIDALARVIETGKEYRPVECFTKPEPMDREVATYRSDTGEEVERRPMTAEEIKGDLFRSQPVSQ